MADEAAMGRLSEAQNEHIFRTEILPDYLPDDIGNADRPTLVVLGGQPGSGKTALLTASLTELEETGPAIRVVGDDLRSYHPGFVAHQNADPMTASRFTQADAGIWSEKLLTAATERGVHVVFETTMRTPDNVEKVMTAGRSADYRVEARVLAVSPRVSWQGCHYRFEELHHADAAARIPPRTIHDAAVTGLADSLDRIERRRLVDRIVIQTSAGERIYDNQIEHGQWRSAPAARDALEEARNRPLSREEIERFAQVWEKVVARMLARGALAQKIDEVWEQSRVDLAQLFAERRRADASDGKSAREIAHQPGPERVPAIAAQGGDMLSPRYDAGEREKVTNSHNEVVRPGETLVPAIQVPDLSAVEIDRKLQDSALLAEKRAEIERLSRLVYGNAAAISATVQAIDCASTGSVAEENVRAGKLGPMAGEGRGFLRAESPERQTAKAHLPQLATALQDYGRTVDFERHQIESRHREEQSRHRQEIRAPSAALSAVLESSAHEQANRLTVSPQLRRELDTITTSINRRMTPSDRAALKVGDFDRLSQTLAVSTGRVQALARVQSQMQAAYGQAQRHRHQIDVGRGPTISIKQ